MTRHPPTTWNVFDDDSLPQFATKLLGNKPSGGVGNSAGAEGDDEADWLTRISRLPPRW